jgi:hypothetical protein
MRYEKKVLILSSVLAALLLIWAAGLVFSPERVAARSESAKLISGKTADAASISIVGEGGATIELIKSGAAWELVDGQVKLPVQASRVSGFLDSVVKVTRLRPVAKSKDSWTSYQLDEAQAKKATIKDGAGKTLAEFWVGGYGPTGNEVYLRRSGSDASYTAEGDFASYLGYGRSSWLDLRVFPDLKEADVQSLSLKSGIVLEKGKSAITLDYSLRRDGKGWKAGAATIDAEGAEALLRSIVATQGEDYVSAPPADGFAKIQARIALELGSGASKVLEVGAASGDSRFLARLAGSPFVFQLSSYSLSSALKSQASLAVKK